MDFPLDEPANANHEQPGTGSKHQTSGTPSEAARERRLDTACSASTNNSCFLLDKFMESPGRAGNRVRFEISDRNISMQAMLTASGYEKFRN
jgi:hypothetical protein